MIAPDFDQLEISLFGPGYGESILIHTGNNEWIIVDSCIDTTTGRPPAITYLENIGVNPSTDVKMIVSTHWHDDHIRGLSDIVRICGNAEFVCSTALKYKEFFELIELYRQNGLDNVTGVSEFTSIFDILKKRGSHPKWAVSDRMIWKTNFNINGSSINCSIHSLSPSDKEIEKTFISISDILPKCGSYPARIVPPKQNESAVVLWVQVGIENVFLLGSDLEEKGDLQTGWSAIIDSLSLNENRAIIYKVAHHGSITGHHQPVWDNLLSDESLAILTPFTRGKKLPSESDIQRIISMKKKSYITSNIHKNLSIKKRDKLVKRFTDKYTKYIRFAEHPCGQIKLKKNIIDKDHRCWDIELLNGAIELQ